MKENEYISREEVISQLEYCLANFTDYKKALEETLDKVKHTRTISLPKGHGRLIDADELKKKTYRIDDSLSLSSRDVIDEEDIDDAPTIIKSNKKEERRK